MIHDILSDKPRIELIQADCIDVMKEMQDKAFSLAVVDPPYGIEQQISIGGGRHTKSKAKFHNLYKDGSQWDKRPSKSYFDELRRVTVNQICCGGNYFADMLPVSRGWVIWDKRQDNLTVVTNELIYTSFDIGIKTFRRWKGLDNGFMNPEGKNIHPTQKTPALYRWLLTNYAKQGDTILDTHLGSGSSAIAAWELGFDFLGIELDVDYYAAAKYRIQERMRQPFLPLGEKEKVEQRAWL